MAEKSNAVDAITAPNSDQLDDSDLEKYPSRHHHIPFEGFEAKDGSTFPHVFSDLKVAEYWRRTYEETKYEGRHRFDPDFEWTSDEERKVRRKIDLWVMSWVWFMFFVMDIIRRNINRAISDKFLVETGQTTNDFNNGQTIYYVSFLCAELPANMLSKKYGPDRIVPLQFVLWSVVNMCQAAIRNRTDFFILRFLLGVCQGGFIPDMVLYVSYWYRGAETGPRLSFFWTAIPINLILGTLLASGLLEMRGIHGLAGWKWMFIIEGILSLVVGLLSFFVMNPSPTQTQRKLTGNRSWFSEREEKIMVNRILRDDPSKGDMNNRQPVTLAQVWTTLKDYDLYPLYALGFFAFMPYQPISTYLSYVLKQLGFSTFLSNVLTMPGQAIFVFNILALGLLSWKFKERALIASISNWWLLPFFIALIAVPHTVSNWVRYVLLTGVTAIPYSHSILVSWISRNSNTVRTRAVAAALYNMCYQVGSIVATQIYRTRDGPYYYKANKGLLVLVIFNILLFIFVKVYYIKRNAWKKAKWDSMTREQRLDYIHNSTDSGPQRLDFMLAH